MKTSVIGGPMRRARAARGFAIIELMIVVLIIMILSLVAGRAYTQYIARSRLSECITKIHELRRLAWDYFHNEAHFPNETTFWQHYKGAGAETEYNYATNYDKVNQNKNCVRNDTNKGKGNDCSFSDPDNKNSSTNVPTSFVITCMHDHFPAADYVIVTNTVPNAIMVKTTAAPP